MAQVLSLACTLNGQEGRVSSIERGGDRGSLSLLDQFKVSEAVGSRGRNQIRVAIVTQDSRIARTPKKSLVCIKCVPAFLEFHSIGTLTETEENNLAHVERKGHLTLASLTKLLLLLSSSLAATKHADQDFKMSGHENKTEQNKTMH